MIIAVLNKDTGSVVNGVIAQMTRLRDEMRLQLHTNQPLHAGQIQAIAMMLLTCRMVALVCSPQDWQHLHRLCAHVTVIMRKLQPCDDCAPIKAVLLPDGTPYKSDADGLVN